MWSKYITYWNESAKPEKTSKKQNWKVKTTAEIKTDIKVKNAGVSASARKYCILKPGTNKNPL